MTVCLVRLSSRSSFSICATLQSLIPHLQVAHTHTHIHERFLVRLFLRGVIKEKRKASTTHILYIKRRAKEPSGILMYCEVQVKRKHPNKKMLQILRSGVKVAKPTHNFVVSFLHSVAQDSLVVVFTTCFASHFPDLLAILFSRLANSLFFARPGISSFPSRFLTS